MSKKLVIFGNGDIAQLADYYFSNDTALEVEAFTVDRNYLKDDSFNGRPNVAFEDLIDIYPPDDFQIFIAISYARMNKVRQEKANTAKAQGYKLASYISSKATIFPDLSDNENCFILENNTIQPYASIGNNVTLWSGNHIGHHSMIEDNCFITSHVVVSGGVKVGSNSFIGVNATLHDHIEIASFSLIAAGSLVNKNTEEYGVYIGSPAKKTKPNSLDIDL